MIIYQLLEDVLSYAQVIILQIVPISSHLNTILNFVLLTNLKIGEALPMLAKLANLDILQWWTINVGVMFNHVKVVIDVKIMSVFLTIDALKIIYKHAKDVFNLVIVRG